MSVQADIRDPEDSWWPALIRIGIVSLVLLAAVFVIFGFPIDKTPQGKITVLVGGGVFEANTVEDIKYPDDGVYVKGWFDHAYDYPTTQRSYIVSSAAGDPDADDDSGVVVPSRDGVPMQFNTAVYFKLNEDLIGDFHNEIGIKTEAWTVKGWDRMLTQYFRKVEEDTIRNFAQQYTVDDLYCPACAGESDSIENLLARAEQEMGATLKEDLARAQGQEYFCGPDATPGNCTDIQFVINNVRPANATVLNKYAELRTSATEIAIQQNNVNAAQLQARAARQLTKEGTLSDEYVRLRYIDALREAVERESVDFWVLNGQDNVTVPGPQGESSSGE